MKPVTFFIIFLLVLSVAHTGYAQPVPFLAKDGKYQFVNAITLKPLNANKYESASPFSEGLARVTQNGVESYIREDGSEAFKLPSGSEGSDFHESRAIISGRSGHILMAKDGTSIMNPTISDIATISEGLAVAGSEHGQKGYIDIKTQEIKIPFNYEFARPFSEGYAAVRQNGKWGYIDKTGKLAVPAIYEDATAFGNNLGAVRQDGKWGFVNLKGDMIIAPIYEKVTPFTANYAFVKKADNQWMVIDRLGKETGPVLPYRVITQLSDGLAGVMVGNKWGFADYKGTMVIQPAYSIVSSFQNGLAMVVQNGQRFWINKQGKEYRSK